MGGRVLYFDSPHSRSSTAATTAERSGQPEAPAETPIRLIVPHKSNRRRKGTKDGRKLRGYCRRCKNGTLLRRASQREVTVPSGLPFEGSSDFAVQDVPRFLRQFHREHTAGP